MRFQISKSLPSPKRLRAGRQMSNECQSLNFCNATLSGLVIIKAKALSYGLFRLLAGSPALRDEGRSFEIRVSDFR